MGDLLKREVRVALSKRAQPVWFRIVKWAIILTLVALFYDSGRFWWIMLGLTFFGFGLHIFYRHKTHRWTRAWGGWNDLEAGR